MILDIIPTIDKCTKCTNDSDSINNVQPFDSIDLTVLNIDGW